MTTAAATIFSNTEEGAHTSLFISQNSQTELLLFVHNGSLPILADTPYSHRMHSHFLLSHLETVRPYVSTTLFPCSPLRAVKSLQGFFS